MPYSVIVSQGRVADRTEGALIGARMTGDALSRMLNTTPRTVGAPSRARHDDWTESLPAAAGVLRELRGALAEAIDAGTVPVLATNTCAASLATIPEVAARYPDAVLLWIDAHGDFNTPATTGSGYLGGMVLAAVCGLWDSGYGAGLSPSRVAVIGARDIDPAERELLRDAGVRVLPPHASTPEAVRSFVADRPVWIHIDWDVLEPGYIPAAYRVPGGLAPHEVQAILAALPPGAVRGVELAEFEAGDPDAPEHLSIELILETVMPIVGSAGA